MTMSVTKDIVHKHVDPIVSVVVPFYNTRTTLKDCLGSLLNQTYPKELFEIILIDDGSTDSGYNVIMEDVERALKNGFRIELIHIKRTGPAGARNRGIALSKGNIIAFTDADCIVDNTWIENLVKFKGKNLGGVYGETKTLTETPLIWPLILVPAKGFKYTTCNIAYSKDVLAKVGFFDEKFREPFREDTDLALSVKEAGWQIAYEPSAVVRHPVKTMRFSKLFHIASRYQYDNLLYKKHPQTFSSEIRVPGTLLGPFSSFSLIFFSFLTLFILISLMFDLQYGLLISLLFFMSYVFFFIVYGYKMVTLDKAMVPLSLRVKCSILLIGFAFTLTLARFYGSLKFRKFFV
jgi:glycosyltransferase involved in cell wall biosynthesis